MSTITIDRAVVEQALEALEAGLDVNPILAGEAEEALRSALAQQDEPVQEPEALKDPAEYDDFAAAIRHNERITTWRYDSVGTVAFETVYETIIHWDEGGGKRSRRELARRIVDLFTAPPQRQPLTEEEIERIGMTHQSLRQVVRAVERAHGIKE